MKLVSLTLKNFRCYQTETTITFEDLTTLIGRNDVGKSTILEALEIFFNNNGNVKIEPGDCSVSSTDKDVEIICEFTDLPTSLVLDSQAQTSLADEYLLAINGNLRIKKIFHCSSSKPRDEVFVCANHPTANGYDNLLELTNTVLKARLKELNISSETVSLNSNPSIRQAIWDSCSDLKLVEKDIPIAKEDGKRIWEKLSEHLPIFALFQSDRASKDTDSEVQDPMKLAVSTALADPAIQEKLNDVVGAVRNRAEELARRTHEALSRIDPDLASKLIPDFKAEPKWSGLFTLSLNSDDGIPVNKRGSGIRRMILVSFFRAEVERRLAELGGGSIIYALEEPETSQHPRNQKVLLESLQDLAEEPGCQVILTTHSPGFAAYLPIESFRFIKKEKRCQPVIESCCDQTWDEIADTLGVVPDNRVKVLICVEGPNDVIALQCLSRALHAANPDVPDLSTNPGITFVVLGGGALKNWVDKRYLKGLGRPEVHIYDSDVPEYHNAITKVNARDDGSWGVLTKKREIENYLHPETIKEGLSVEVIYGDDDDVPALISSVTGLHVNKIKKQLANKAFPNMTAERIAVRDPNGEVEGWFLRIGSML